MMTFYKFPRTPHLFILPGIDIRDDKILSLIQAESFYSNPITIEEKVDGANVGISFGSMEGIKVQNRGNYMHPGDDWQFEKLWDWIYQRHDLLTNLLQDKYILFGEWCYFKHSISYTQLPDWFIGIDIYHIQEKRFFSVNRRNQILEQLGIFWVPEIKRGVFNKTQIIDLLTNVSSKLGAKNLEGLYLRLDNDQWLKSRAKVVRSDFIQNISTHWRQETPVKNVKA